MRLSIMHETQYRYSNPVALSQQLLHLTPRALPWETVRARLRAAEAPPVEPAEFLFESPHIERSRELADYAVKSFTARRGILEAATDLTRRIHKDFKFDRTATSI